LAGRGRISSDGWGAAGCDADGGVTDDTDGLGLVVALIPGEAGGFCCDNEELLAPFVTKKTTLRI